ncbi:uncharacterized protein LOC123531963 isoform X2 [Mercenaria mercenaria]|uniref:uncharacterized protein LOC123531963 isoform X2 n=1 Tax=Mercenaria mercenaria TaxID=6596 RepID=UPI001E1DC601|nr:uncharacterized protein LOC123531963 isoform X2 [Mercenaria mercenaria]
MTNNSVEGQTVKRQRKMKKGKETEDRTLVVKLGLEYFTTADSTYPESVETRESMEDESRSKKQKSEKKDGRFYKFVKRHFLQRKNSSNDVKEIRIVPDGDEFKWARRSAGSAASRSSNETTSSDGDRLEVVHDMAEEYIPEV